jgi:hypothetical protein
LAITFNQQLDPYQRVDSSAARVMLLPDSLPVPTLSLLPREEHDSLYPRIVPFDTTTSDSTAALDSLPPADSVQADTLAPGGPEVDPSKGIATADTAMQLLLEERPRLFNRLIIRLAEPLIPDGRYFVAIFGIRNVNGVEGEPGGGAGFVAPIPPPPPEPPVDDSLPPAPRDSLAIDRDSLARPDSSEVPDP